MYVIIIIRLYSLYINSVTFLRKLFTGLKVFDHEKVFVLLTYVKIN